VDFQDIVEAIGQIVDALGVVIIVLGVLVATGAAVRNLHRRQQAYQPYRRQLGRSILLGLEFLVAADIIRTVAVAPTFTDLGVLALIVAIRTFLSFSLELEITGRWPWQQSDRQDTRTDAAPGATPDVRPPPASS
jgi:uncharacterized membrane protein